MQPAGRNGMMCVDCFLRVEKLSAPGTANRGDRGTERLEPPRNLLLVTRPSDCKRDVI